MKNYFYLALALISFTYSFGQNNSESWDVEYSKSKSFIENDGQFDQYQNESTGDIKYAVDFGFSKIFFGLKGVSYSFLQIKKKSREERADIMNQPIKTFKEHKQKEELIGKHLVKKDEVNMHWENINPAVSIVGFDPTNDSHGYTFTNEKGETENISSINAFKKLIYKNIYPNIDVEYEVHPKIGIKYAFIVHPGANPSDLNMLYDREFSIQNDAVHVKTLFGDIIDHAPITFYQDNHDEIIDSKYASNGKSLSFNLAEYDISRTIVIDPWVQTPNDPNSNWNCVWELDKDAAGNVYVIAGIMPMQLLKYNPAGVLQWTHNTPYDTTAWLGTMATDDLGNTYVTNGTSYRIQKINTAGGVVWNNVNPSGPGTGLNTEFWNITFNCDQTKLLIGGSGGFIDGRVYDIDMNTGNSNAFVEVTEDLLVGIPVNIQEVRAMCPSPSGKYYYVTLDTIGYLTDDLTLCSTGTSMVKDDHGIGWGYKAEDWRYNNTGIKALRADADFVYVNKGNELQKRSLQNFSVIGSVTIPGGVLNNVFLGGNQNQNAGIDIDDCGNIYVGSKTGVYAFNPVLTQIGFYPTTFKVWDVRVSTAGDIIACGGTGDSGDNSRSGGIQSFAASACSPMAFTCCNAAVCTPNDMCVFDAPIALTPASAGGTWSGVGVDAFGNFDPAIAGVGVTFITYTLICGTETIAITVNPCTTIEICEESNGDLTASNGNGTYTWYEGILTPSTTPITTEQECIDCPTATPAYFFGLYTGCDLSDCATVDTVWTQYATGTTTAPSGYPIQIIDGNGLVVTIDNQGVLLPCSVTPCTGVTITVATTAQSDPNCFGGSDGSATVNATGGTGPYTYTWMPGSLNGATQNTLSLGTYTIDVVDNLGCPGAGSVTIGEPAELIASAVSTPENCGLSNGTVTGSATGGTGTYTYSWSPAGGNIANPTGLAVGTYTVTITDQNSCTDQAVVDITSSGGPTISLDASSDVNCFGGTDGSATVSATLGTGPYTYSWMPGSLTGAIQNALGANSYTVTVTDASGCTDNVVVDILEPTELIASAVSTQTTCGLSNGTVTGSATGGTGTYTYSWSPAGGNIANPTGLPAGTYTVTITDQNTCVDQAVVDITSAGGPIITLDASASVSCFGAGDGSATVSTTNGTGPYTYSWMPGSLSGANQNGLGPNSYTVTVTDAIGCTDNIIVDILEPTEIILSTSNIIDANCGASDGAATVDAIGGAGTYTYVWTPNVGNTATATNIAAGAYTVDVSDQDGCSSSINFTIINIGGPTLTVQPTTDASCFGLADGEASIQANGGTAPYTYAWAPTGGNSATASNLIAGSYIITVTDATGCVSAETIVVNEPSEILITETIIDEDCGQGNGDISLSVTGGTSPYTYLWGGLQTTSSISSLISGNYTVTVTDAVGCSATGNYIVNSIGSIPVIVTPLSATIIAGETVQLIATGADTYIWTPSQGLDCDDCPNPIASPTITTAYTVTGTNAAGCTGQYTVTIFVEMLCGDLFVPNMFSPNDDLNNDMLCVYGSCISQLSYSIYNRWGEKVFTTDSVEDCWDGYYKGKPLNTGVYVYTINVTLMNGDVVEDSGNITLVR